MYGTVARLQVKPGMDQQFLDFMDTYERADIPGFVATWVYRLDDDPNGFYMSVAFEDRESYRRNAEDPEQDRRYRQMREFLAADPKWHDGEIAWASQSTARTGSRR
jgi:quinol monooxygenase YgiN